MLKRNNYSLEDGEPSVLDSELSRARDDDASGSTFEIRVGRQVAGRDYENQGFCQSCWEGGTLVCCDFAPPRTVRIVLIILALIQQKTHLNGLVHTTAATNARVQVQRQEECCFAAKYALTHIAKIVFLLTSNSHTSANVSMRWGTKVLGKHAT